MGRRRRPTRIGSLTHIHREPGAWSVHVTRRGHTFSDYFGDAVWGGRERALLAAQHCRDRLLLRVAPDSRVRRQIPKGTRSVTGVVGVSLERQVVGARVYERYVAHWQDPDEGPQRRRFLIARHGKQQALALAMEAREAGVAHSHAQLVARQREEARRRLQKAPPRPQQVKEPLSRKGISMARRRPRRRGQARRGRRSSSRARKPGRNANVQHPKW